ncbi:MAG: hypothetical protein ACLFPP_12160 [Spirochaetaceae bacterium]
MAFGKEEKSDVAIAVPANYLLTPFGDRYCRQRGIPLSEITTSDVNRGSGFVWQQVNVGFLERLVALNLISEIEIRRHEFGSKRGEIVRLSKEIGYALIVDAFRTAVSQRLRELPAVERLLEHPSVTTGGNGRQFDPALVQKILATQKPLLESFREALLEEGRGAVAKEDFFHAEKVRFLRRAVDSLNDESWFLLYVIDHRGKQAEVHPAILELLSSFLKRVVIPEYGGLILTELLNAAESVHLRDLAERDQYLRTHPHELEQKLRDPEFVRKLTSRGAINKEFLTLAYKFDSGEPSRTGRRVLEILLSNGGLLGYRSRNDILNRPQKRVRREKLVDLVAQDSEGTLAGSLLGIYLNALQETASEQGVDVDSEVVRDEREGRTRTIIRISF